MTSHHQNSSYAPSRAHGLVKAGLVAALYIVLTLLVAPVAFGPVQFRISEGLNYLGLYNKRYIYAVTIGVFIVNYFQFGPIDMVVGSAATFVFLWIGRWAGEATVRILQKTGRLKANPMIIKYIIMGISFVIQMLPIAGMLLFVGAEAAFWPVYISLAISEAIAMLVTAFVMYPLSKRVDFEA